jgi:pimeloyl-ACP methyl ester carboxylesterase
MKRRFVSTEGELAYVDEGEGPAVVLLHGFPTSSFLWRAFVPPLAARFRVIAPDLLGYGDSDKPEGADLSMTAQVGYVQELLESLAVQRFAVVGHDLGGVVAQLLALEAGAGAIVLLDAAAFDVWPIEGVRMIQATTPEQETPEFVEELVRLTLDLGLGHKGRLTEEILRSYVQPFASQDGAKAFFRAVRAIDGEGLAGRDRELAELDRPVLLVWGEDDPYLPVEVGERLNELIPTSTLALLPGCSHFVTEDAPETLVPLVYEYLRARYLGEPHGHEHVQPLIQLGRPERP